jgi:hypothetical protein
MYRRKIIPTTMLRMSISKFCSVAENGKKKLFGSGKNIQTIERLC